MDWRGLVLVFSANIMTQIILEKDEELAQWAEDRFPEFAPLSRPLTSIGFASSAGEILAVAVFNSFRHHDIECSIVAATPKWATPGNIRVIFDYPFVQLGVKRMTAITAKKNKRCRKLLEGVGFRLEGVHPYADKGTAAACTYGIYSDRAMEWLNG